MAERQPTAGNLPADLTSFVGRAEELPQVRRMLSQSRLVTLTGVGGVGKSRLALRAARQLSRAFADGTWLVELSSLLDGALLPQAVGQALGLSDQAASDPTEELCGFVARKQLLIVMDNCEHLVPACQRLLSALLRAAPGLRVLATSRELLWIPGEQVCEVRPLGVPEPNGSLALEALANSPGVALFTRRAREITPRFAVTTGNADAVARVCELSEGMPLFLELAAAQLRSLSLEELAGRLSDRFHVLTQRNSAVVARHQSLRAAVEWSFTLCSEAERLVWTRTSVFAGRFNLEAVEAVCAGQLSPEGEVLDALARLIDKSVLACAERDGDMRYWMLDSLRLYGLEQLRSPQASGATGLAGELELRRRHRDHYLDLAEQFNADWFGPRQVAWSRRMHAELPELRAALAFCLNTPGEARFALRLAGTLTFFWWACGATREGRLWLERALAADPSPSRDRAAALIAYVRVLASTGMHDEAAQPARECLELARRLDDPALLADALSGRGLNLMQAGDVAAALSVLDEALERAAALPNLPVALAIAALYRSMAALADGDPAAADAMAARSREVCLAHGDQWRLNHALGVSMNAALALGDVARATAYGRESARGQAALGDTNGLSLSLEALAWTAAAAADHRRAARLLGAADRQARSNGGKPFTDRQEFYRTGHARCEARARATLGNAYFDAEFRAGAQLTLDEAIAYARSNDPPQRTQGARPAPEPSGGLPQLTKRELEIAHLIAEGMTNKQLANRLVISRRTAEGHVEHILGKLGLTTRTQIASWVLTGKSPQLRP